MTTITPFRPVTHIQPETAGRIEDALLRAHSGHTDRATELKTFRAFLIRAALLNGQPVHIGNEEFGAMASILDDAMLADNPRAKVQPWIAPELGVKHG